MSQISARDANLTPFNFSVPLDSSGNVVPTALINYTSSSVLTSSLVAKAAPGSLFGIDVTVDPTLSAGPWWLMVHDATSRPADGTVTPAKCYGLPAGSTAFNAAWPNPVAFLNGIVISVSSTGPFTSTTSNHAFISADVL